MPLVLVPAVTEKEQDADVSNHDSGYDSAEKAESVSPSSEDRSTIIVSAVFRGVGGQMQEQTQQMPGRARIVVHECMRRPRGGILQLSSCVRCTTVMHVLEL